MSNIISNLKKLNFYTSAIAVFCPNGRIISVNKIKGFNLHIEYINVLYRGEKEIKNILSNIDLKYFYENPSEVINEIIPIFNQNNYSVYMNLTPNTTTPTNYGLFFFPKDIPKSTRRILNSLEEKLSSMIFVEIAKYNESINGFETYLNEDYPDEPNCERLYEVVNNKINNHISKEK